MRRGILLAALAAAIVALPGGVVAYTLYYNPNPDRLAEAIEKLGYLPITPPTLLRSPGSIYHVSRTGWDTRLLCQADPVRLEKAIQRSATEALVSQELRKASFGVGAKLAEAAQSKTEAEMLQSVNLVFDKVQVLEVSIEALADIATELQQRPSCENAVLQYLAAGDNVCQVQTVLLASAAYSISRERSAKGSGSLDAETLQAAVKATIDPTAQVVDSTKVAGDGLYYGMKFTPLCMSLRGEPPRRLAMRWHERLWDRLGLFN